MNRILPNPLKFRRSKGFTLAEVLITLSILGIIAAITIPNIINNYNQRVTVTRVKKMHSVLDTAYSNAVAEDFSNESKIFGYNEKGAKEVADMLRPYFQISNDCGTDSNRKKACGMRGERYEVLNKNASKSKWGDYANDSKYYAFRLKDGSLIWFRGYDKDTSIAIWYDVNGNKEPNTFGKDVFHFAKYGHDTNSHYGNEDNTPSKLTYIRPVGDNAPNFEQRCLADNAEGMGCTAWVVYKGNMDYLRCRKKLTWDMNKCP